MVRRMTIIRNHRGATLEVFLSCDILSRCPYPENSVKLVARSTENFQAQNKHKYQILFPKKSPLQDFIKSTLVFAFRREFRRTFEQQSAPNNVVIWHRTKSIMGHFFFNFFNPFRYDFVHPSWCDFSFGSSTCTAKEQTIDNYLKKYFSSIP